jgi:hypothetical protein
MYKMDLYGAPDIILGKSEIHSMVDLGDYVAD